MEVFNSLARHLGSRISWTKDFDDEVRSNRRKRFSREFPIWQTQCRNKRDVRSTHNPRKEFKHTISPGDDAKAAKSNEVT